ncbi:MAG: tRNA (N6-threonylcarbamoyladenosine(37)-N6)-methyltransferase TrmO [Candidatus Hadarchaeum sp.]|uniref:tRNA (N6-threonylcarbamoyladenosine(37)-N6)-methyltransferase TrmO n=1 Tax=Candidatus Hadarchaeum sp. TaxID=2883567 RepID=UPI0031819D75
MKGELRFIGTVERIENEEAEIAIFPEFCPGLRGIENYSHLIILYWLHQRDTAEQRQVLQVIPKRHPGAPLVGVFASRSPTRPNPIGMCVVELIRVENCRLCVKGLDAVEGSPIVDIKPYLPRADSVPGARAPEWMSHGPTT